MYKDQSKILKYTIMHETNLYGNYGTVNMEQLLYTNSIQNKKYNRYNEKTNNIK